MNEDLARIRFFILGLVRLGGVILVFFGITLIQKRWVEPAEIVGGVLIALGAIEVLVLPLVLARKWRSPLP